MKAQLKQSWVSKMADYLTSEILAEMSDIHTISWRNDGREEPVMHTVCGFASGDYDLRFYFHAEPRMFRRLARNMLGEEPENMELVQEFAQEFFNILCGRFIAEVGRMVNREARFLPTLYVETHSDAENVETIQTRWFVSDEQELAKFSWGALVPGI